MKTPSIARKKQPDRGLELARKALLVVGLLIGFLGPVAASLNGFYFSGSDALWPLAWFAWAPMGFLILLRRPGNWVGRGLMFIGVLMGVSFLLGSIAATPAIALETRVWAEIVNIVLGVPPWLGVVWLLVVFPTGSYAGPAERWVGRLIVGFGAIAAGAFAVHTEPMFETGRPSPLAVPALRPIAAAIADDSGFLAVIALIVAALVLLVRRWRSSVGVQRAQFRWLLFGASLFAIVITLGQFIPDDSSALYLWLPAGMAIPATIGVAVLRYRLFEIDRLISRTLTYASVLALLALLVIGLVAVFANFVPSDDPLVVATATLAAAAMFNPLRRRVHAFVDRRFNRARFNTAQVIEDFTDSLRVRIDPADVLDGWMGVVTKTMQPESVTVWVRS